MHASDVKLAQWDYGRFLAEYRLTEEVVQMLMAQQWYHEESFELIKRRKSALHGFGYFTGTQLPGYIAFAIARRADTPTSAGRFINHAPGHLANSVFVLHANGNLFAVSRRVIMAGEEILIDYRQAGRHAKWLPAPSPDEISVTALGMPE